MAIRPASCLDYALLLRSLSDTSLSQSTASFTNVLFQSRSSHSLVVMSCQLKQWFHLSRKLTRISDLHVLVQYETIISVCKGMLRRQL